MKVIGEAKNVASLATGLVIGTVLAVPALVVALFLMPFEKAVTAEEFADFLQRCIDGKVDDDEIDSLTSRKFAEPRLKAIKNKLSDLGADWTTPEARLKLRELLSRVRSEA